MDDVEKEKRKAEAQAAGWAESMGYTLTDVDHETGKISVDFWPPPHLHPERGKYPRPEARPEDTVSST